jgi:hypothetical protein
MLDDILPLPETDINNRLSELAAKRSNEIGLGLLFMLLTCQDSEAPTVCLVMIAYLFLQFFKYMNFSTRDGLTHVCQQLHRMLGERYHKLQDIKLERVSDLYYLSLLC